MSRYRSKPIFVDAIQWKGDNYTAVLEWMHAYEDNAPVAFEQGSMKIEDRGLRFYCLKSYQWLVVMSGDYLIAESDGKGVYPCVEQRFLERYEAE